MRDKKVEINGTKVVALLPLWCLILDAWVVVIFLVSFIGGVTSLTYINTPATNQLEPGQNAAANAAIAFGFAIPSGLLAILIFRGGFNRTWTIVKYCTLCRVPLDHSLSICPQCGGPLRRVSVGRARASGEQRPLVLAGELSTGISEKNLHDHANKGVSYHPGRDFVDVFISHVEEDSNIATEIAQCLEKAGYTTWYYERDSVPGTSYLAQVGESIDWARAVLLIISESSLSSYQVNNEVIRAYETGKPFIPVLRNISYVEFQRRHQVWRQALVGSTAIPITEGGVQAAAPRLIKGIRKTLGF